MSKLQLLHGSAVQNGLESDTNVEIFRYEMNKFGVGALLTLGLFCLIAAFGTWFGTSLANLLWKLVFAALILGGMTLMSMASYWMNFARDSFVATGAKALWIGGKDRAWKIEWSLLDARALGLHDLELSPLKGVLPIDVGGQKIKLPLFNPFAYLLDIQNFMFFVLNYLKENQEEGVETDVALADEADQADDVDEIDEIDEQPAGESQDIAVNSEHKTKE